MVSKYIIINIIAASCIECISFSLHRILLLLLLFFCLSVHLLHCYRLTHTHSGILILYALKKSPWLPSLFKRWVTSRQTTSMCARNRVRRVWKEKGVNMCESAVWSSQIFVWASQIFVWASQNIPDQNRRYSCNNRITNLNQPDIASRHTIKSQLTRSTSSLN